MQQVNEGNCHLCHFVFAEYYFCSNNLPGHYNRCLLKLIIQLESGYIIQIQIMFFYLL